MFEDMFNLQPQVWAKSLVNGYYCSHVTWVPLLLLVQHALNNVIKLAHWAIKNILSYEHYTKLGKPALYAKHEQQHQRQKI
jgi:hypothetical protein